MNDLASIRIYFRRQSRLPCKGFWKRLLAPSLGSHLLQVAKAFGIEQALYQPVIAGYLKGDPISYDMSEIPPVKLPSCVEMIDVEDKLRRFLKEHEKELEETRIVLFKSEILFSPKLSSSSLKAV